MPNFNNRIKQIILLSIIILLGYLLVKELFFLLPGLLGALTLYILSRSSYFDIVYRRKWKKGWAAGLFIIYYLLLIGLPVFIAIELISPKINTFLDNPTEAITTIKQSINTIQDKIGYKIIPEASLTSSLSKVSAFIPTILNSTATLLINLVIMLFILFYMLYNGRDLERMLNRIIPLKQKNIDSLASETRKLVRANALGIPLISIIQGLTAALGYFIFGVREWGLWAFFTGVFAFFPVVGTMIIWVPLVIYTYAMGQTGQAIGILVYSAVVVGNIDNLVRMRLMRKLGDVHPVVTILGVIVGIGLFGFVGLIFGPLLISYIILLFEIYMNEFVDVPIPHARTLTPEETKDDVEPGE
jgi:predicted PurR-regulated permease PerM